VHHLVMPMRHSLAFETAAAASAHAVGAAEHQQRLLRCCIIPQLQPVSCQGFPEFCIITTHSARQQTSRPGAVSAVEASN